MFEIANFTNGLIPNAGWSRGRNTAGRDWSDLRPSEQGFLEDRRGHTLVYDDEPITQIFAYKTLLIAIIDSELKWARAQPRGETVTFNSFSPAVNVNDRRKFSFQTILNATGEYIFMGNGTGELTGGIGGLFVIDLDDVFDPETPSDPTVVPVYLPTPPNLTVVLATRGNDDDNHLERTSINFRSQLIQIKDDVEIVVSTPSNTVRVDDINQLRSGSTVRDVSSRAEKVSAIQFTYNLPNDTGAATHLDIYSTNPYYNGEPGERVTDDTYPYHLYRRVALDTIASEPTRFGAPFDLPDVTGFQPLVESDRTHWDFIEVDGIRSYVIASNSNTLHLSYYDASRNIRLFRNFSDTVSLPLGGETVTGLKFLRRNLLAVYTPHRIVLVGTDPIPERMRVSDIYTTGENDEAVGCIAPESLVQVGSFHYFFAPNKWVYRFGGQDPQWVSASVQPILQTVAVLEEDDASLALVDAVGVMWQGNYMLSVPSLKFPPVSAMTWRDNPVVWRSDTGVNWRNVDLYSPNITLIYEIKRNRWYRDSFGVKSYTKDERDRLYGVSRDALYALYDNDDEREDQVQRVWQSNQILLKGRTQIYNAFVKTLKPAVLEVTVKSESGSETQILDIPDPDDYWSQYMGVHLYGRTVEVTVKSTQSLLLDRISINEDQEMR